MRVVAGTRKRLQLITVPGNHTRPTTDRIKETLFNMLGPELSQARFLDLFAGSGQIGIEALSRGAAECVFVENYREAVSCIRKNLAHTGFEDCGRIMAADVFSALAALPENHPFDLIFMDPPYDRKLEQKALELISAQSLLTKDGTIVVEASLNTEICDLSNLGFTVTREKKYKTNKHIFLKRGCANEESNLPGEL